MRQVDKINSTIERAASSVHNLSRAFAQKIHSEIREIIEETGYYYIGPTTESWVGKKQLAKWFYGRRNRSTDRKSFEQTADQTIPYTRDIPPEDYYKRAIPRLKQDQFE